MCRWPFAPQTERHVPEMQRHRNDHGHGGIGQDRGDELLSTPELQEGQRDVHRDGTCSGDTEEPRCPILRPTGSAGVSRPVCHYHVASLLWRTRQNDSRRPKRSAAEIRHGVDPRSILSVPRRIDKIMPSSSCDDICHGQVTCGVRLFGSGGIQVAQRYLPSRNHYLSPSLNDLETDMAEDVTVPRQNASELYCAPMPATIAPCWSCSLWLSAAWR